MFIDLPRIIKGIRVRLGLNQAAFAKMIGTAQNTVSQYEKGRLEPGKAVLLNLQRLAETEEEKKTFAVWLAGDPPTEAEESENIVFQIRKAAKMSVIDFATALKVAQIDLAAWESGKDIPPPPVVRRLQTIASKHRRADLALILTSDEWKIQALFHPGETFISTARPAPNPNSPRAKAHALLDEIFDSGEDSAIDLAYRQLLLSADLVRGLQKRAGKKHAG